MEKELVKEYLSAISDKWIIHQEVWGTNIWSKNKKRIDAIIVNKEFPHKIFGIEFKQEKVGSFNYFTKWFKQSIGYTQTLFDGFGKVPILMSPAIEYFPCETNEKKYNEIILSRIVGEFGIGEFTKCIYNDYYGNRIKTVYKIIFKQHRVWCTEFGWNKVFIKTDFKQYLEL